MRWPNGIIVALGLSFAAVAPSVGQDAAPEAQAPVQGATQPQPETGKREGRSVAGTSGPHRLSDPLPAPTPNPPRKPRKVVVREGGADEPAVQIVTGLPAVEASSERREAEKFLAAADENLKRVAGRSLDAQQQETISQIRNYVQRALSALKEGDISRGHTLAMKANLLADDLVKH